jgi:hypothetical protein
MAVVWAGVLTLVPYLGILAVWSIQIWLEPEVSGSFSPEFGLWIFVYLTAPFMLVAVVLACLLAAVLRFVRSLPPWPSVLVGALAAAIVWVVSLVVVFVGGGWPFTLLE